MPYKSDAQRKFFHTNTAKKKGITSKVVAEFDSASKGKKLPKKVGKKKKAKKSNPGDLYNKFKSKKGKLRSADAVVKSEQNASHQFA